MTIINVSIIESCSSSDKKNEKVIVVKESDIVRESIRVNGKASHTEKKATIEFDSTKTEIKTITQTIKESGYKPFNN